MDTSGDQFQPGKNSMVAIDGTFTASNTGALVSRDNNGETYSFQIGTFSGSTPVLDITGLEVRFTDVNGLQIDNLAGDCDRRHDDLQALRQRHSSARRRPVALQMLEIYSKALNLSSSGCTFGKNADTKFAALAVKLIGNGTGDGETRAIFGDDHLPVQLRRLDRRRRGQDLRRGGQVGRRQRRERHRRQRHRRQQRRHRPVRARRRGRHDGDHHRAAHRGVRLEHLHLLLDLRGVPQRSRRARTSSTFATSRATRSIRGRCRPPARRSRGRRSGSASRSVP